MNAVSECPVCDTPMKTGLVEGKIIGCCENLKCESVLVYGDPLQVLSHLTTEPVKVDTNIEMHHPLDLTTVPKDKLFLSWLSPLVAQNKPSLIIITKQQSTELFSSSLGTWTHYRGVELKVVDN